MEYKPEYKDNFLYFFDLFDWNGKNEYGYFGDYCKSWLKLFDFVDPRFLYGNLDVIERYLTLCEKYSLYVNLKETKMKQICDYDNYSKYAAEPKLREKEYFYKLLDYNKQCIKYMKVKSVFQHLKDEEMKNYYQWICDNAKITVEAMYEYIKGEKYDNPEQRKENILFLIDIFPDAMSQCIDAEFLINNWNTLDDNFKNKCTSDGLNNFFDGIAKISDIEKKEKWYMYLLQISPVYCFTYFNYNWSGCIFCDKKL